MRHLDQLWWPRLAIRKRDVLEYYSRIAPVLLPHLRDRPLTLKQHYNGPRSPFRWLKDAPAEAPSWMRIAPLPARSRAGAPVRYLLVQDERSLLWAVDYGAIDLHVWTSRTDRPDRPDYVLFDLDPAGVPFHAVVDAALLLRDALETMELEAFVRTTGGDGLHVHVPIARRHDHAEVRAFCNFLATALERSTVGLVTTEASPACRHGVYVDCKMNGRGQQVASVYSLRPTPTAAVSTPLRWDELNGDLDPAAFTMDVVVERIEQGGDLFAPVLHGRARLSTALAKVRRGKPKTS